MDDQHHNNNNTKPMSKSELMSSAKILANAAKSALSNETNKIDKAAVAGASANVLAAAKRYGKLEEKSFGKYVDKAENYLHKYHSSSSSSSSSSPATVNGGGHAGGGNGHSSSGGGSDGGGGGGSSDYIKLAQGLLNKKH
ncbi:hypothetical protein vseg_002011 [Gypsophila vaccaria]